VRGNSDPPSINVGVYVLFYCGRRASLGAFLKNAFLRFNSVNRRAGLRGASGPLSSLVNFGRGQDPPPNPQRRLSIPIFLQLYFLRSKIPSWHPPFSRSHFYLLQSTLPRISERGYNGASSRIYGYIPIQNVIPLTSVAFYAFSLLRYFASPLLHVSITFSPLLPSSSCFPFFSPLRYSVSRYFCVPLLFSLVTYLTVYFLRYSLLP